MEKGGILMASDEISPRAIGERLAMLRQVLGLAQYEVAARAGIPPNTYNQYETGVRRPSLENAVALCEAFDLTLDWIYRGDPSGLRYQMADALKAIRSARTPPR